MGKKNSNLRNIELNALVIIIQCSNNLINMKILNFMKHEINYVHNRMDFRQKESNELMNTTQTKF